MNSVIKLIILSIVLTLPVTALKADERSHRKAAEALLKAMNIEATMMQTVEKMVELEIKRNPQMEMYKDVFRRFFKKHMTGKSLVRDFATLYMEEFTEKELNDITRFYRTKTGKKTIQKLPVLAQKGAQWGQQKVRSNIDELKQMLEEETDRIRNLQQ